MKENESNEIKQVNEITLIKIFKNNTDFDTEWYISYLGHKLNDKKITKVWGY